MNTEFKRDQTRVIRNVPVEAIREGNRITLEQWRSELENRQIAHRRAQALREKREAAKLDQYIREGEERQKRARRLAWVLAPFRTVRAWLRLGKEVSR